MHDPAASESVHPSLPDLVFDARPFQREGREPFPYIVRAMEQLQPGQAFLLINTFDPRPLEAVLEARGFMHHVRQIGPEHFEVRFVRDPSLRPGDLPVIDRRSESTASALVRLVQVLRRLRPGEAFVVRVRELPPDGSIRMLEQAGARVDVRPDQPSGWRVQLTREHPTVRSGQASGVPEGSETGHAE
jgi:uncharacterized protein (DUF2249 family)